MRAISLHPDVIVLTSRLWQTNCTVVHATRSTGGEHASTVEGEPRSAPVTVIAPPSTAPPEGETFVIDSPVLPDELEILPAVLAQAGFTLGGLLATHADWDHLLGRLAFPGAALGCAETTAARLRSAPGEPQRELRDFDEQHYLERPRPLGLASVEALPVPGRCEIGDHELELHPADGHTADGMAVWIPWARVLLAGDYLSAVEIPVLGHGGSVGAYRATLERLRPLVELAEHVVPGHGPVLGSVRALEILGQDLAYLQGLTRGEERMELPAGRRTRTQRQVHVANISHVARQSSDPTA
jgi:glyoxylase-like metal-dependent hydrolase (beta-lactamase superfamily II)